MTTAANLVDGAIDKATASADAKHGPDSITQMRPTDDRWLAILMEEVGEVAHALTYDVDAAETSLYAELIQVAAVARAWAVAIVEEAL